MKKLLVVLSVLSLLTACGAEGTFKYVGPITRNNGDLTMETGAYMRCVAPDGCKLTQDDLCITMDAGDIALANNQVLVDPVTWAYTGTLEIIEAANVQARLSPTVAVTPTMSAGVPVDNAVGAPPSDLVVDQTEGRCNSVVDPNNALKVATETGTKIVIQWHGRCVVVLDEPLTEDQYHGITNGLGASELAVVDPALDLIHLNPPCAETLVRQEKYLLNLYFPPEGTLQVDKTKIGNFCQ